MRGDRLQCRKFRRPRADQFESVELQSAIRGSYNRAGHQTARQMRLSASQEGIAVKTTNFRAVVILAALVILVVTSDALAWGPATHVKLASDVLSHLALLPAGIAALIARHRRFFVYGNVATDTVLAKKLSQVKQVCHRWSTGFSLLTNAESDQGKAFAYGYLSHLAADTVAHNKFLPLQMAVSRSTVSFGHLYWEIRADARIDTPYWRQLRRSLCGCYPEPEHLLREQLQRTLLSFRTNRFLFKRMNLLASEDAWRRSVDFWERLSRFSLDSALVESYHAESIARIIDLLTKGDASVVLQEDPNGNFSLSYAKAQRRQLCQLKRAKIPHDQIIREAALGHAAKQSQLASITES
ncbi:MAG: hypothetical protein B6D36_15130 [Planctomycetes bacterium UTPLA1]|nr:MAG: hypothetical protein B6D36_15130 [Planctomycetes bacterium UTPLA1]